ncbi:MAG: lysylphosphatidylglycerol synthase transmembrane domain-containing protein [Candidatus Competibacterales bacterium]|nr:lysylphosphatidylglycerol synthase transmembrane domain-containing protein [Candidatus Competibacterales bacterium]
MNGRPRHRTTTARGRCAGHARHGLMLTLLGLSVSGTALWYALRTTDPERIAAVFARADWYWALPLLGAYGLHFRLKLMRWRMLLSPVRKASLRELSGPLMLGFFANNVLPARLGEVVRAVLAARCLQLKTATTLASLILERLFDILSVLVIVGAGLAAGARMDARLLGAGQFAGLLAIVGLVLGWMAIHGSRRLSGLLERGLAPLPRRWRQRLVLEVSAATAGLRSLGSRALLPGLIANSLGQWLLMGFALWCSMQAFALSPDLAPAIVLLGATVLATLLPSVPGYFGAIQLAYVLALEPFGVEASAAVAASLFFHLLTYLAVTAAGLYFLHRMGLGLQGLGRLREADRSDGSAPQPDQPAYGRRKR